MSLHWLRPLLAAALAILLLQSILGDSLRGWVMPLGAPFLEAGGWVRDRGAVVWTALFDAERLRQENESLKKADLEDRLRAAGEGANRTVAFLAQHVSTHVPPGAFDLVPAPVLAGPAVRGPRQLWIGRGSEDGVEAGHVVLGPEGIAGEVADVYRAMARVELVTDREAAWGAAVGEESELGMLRGTGAPDMVEFHFHRTVATAQPGDPVVSSGMAASLAPGGIPFGVVEEVTHNAEAQPVAMVRLAMAPGSLRTVFVLRQRRVPDPAKGVANGG